MLEAITQKFNDHVSRYERDLIAMKEVHQEIKDAIETIKDNHLAHIEPDVAEMRADMAWVKKILIGTLMTAVGSFIAALFQLIGKT